MSIAIVTDTNSGISVEEASSIGIFVTSMPVIIDNEAYYEGKNITEQQFYEALTSNRQVTTSQPSPGDLIELWDSILEQGYDQILHIPMSSTLSNSCHAAMGFAEEYEGKVIVVDNRRISVTLRDSVMKAKRYVEEGKSADEIKQLLEKEAYNSTIYISVNTLEFLKRGGRITTTAAMLGTVLNIKPILTLQKEKLDSFSKARSMKKCQQKMIEAIQTDIDQRFANVNMSDLYIGAVGTALSESEQKEWLDAVKNAFPQANVYYSPLSVSIGCHTGPGAVGIGLTVK